MKAIQVLGLLLALLLAAPVSVLAGIPPCPVCGKKVNLCSYHGKHPANEKKCPKCGKRVSVCGYGGKHPNSQPAPAPKVKEAYDVSFACNVPNATMLIDGTNYGTPSGTRYIKIGRHTVKLIAVGYEPFEETINVGANNTSFSFTLQKTHTVYTSEAEQMYRAEAEAGDAISQCNLGYCYDKGQRGLSQDHAKAAYWYQQAAVQGNETAQGNLGILYIQGMGVAQDFQKARMWLQKAAEQNNDNAQCNLGWLYENGKGVSIDYRQAAYWYGRAASNGNGVGQYNLAIIYASGRGVAKDMAMARNWMQKAAANGISAAQEWLRTH
ncbi:MAG: SEL1-like repeat protein [Prevotella sp.]|nr:SEL1-like repeat protein [Prevotella sp.]